MLVIEKHGKDKQIECKAGCNGGNPNFQVIDLPKKNIQIRCNKDQPGYNPNNGAEPYDVLGRH
jgi:hypothetical protein